MTIERIKNVWPWLKYNLRVEETPRQIEPRVRSLFDEAPIMYVLVRSKGNELRVEDCNQLFSGLLGYDVDDILGNPLADFYTPESRATLLEDDSYQQMLAGPSFAQECQLQASDGRVIDTLFHAAHEIDPDGQLAGLGVLFIDITERKRLERQLLHAQKMEAVGRLAGGVAHDFNNMLTVIAGNCNLILDRLGHNHPLYHDISQIIRAADRATSLTRQLLAFSRKQILQPEPLDLNSVVSNMQPALDRLIGQDIDLIIVPEAGPATVHADPGQIEQVVINLTVNARDAMPRGGKLTIRVANVDVDESYGRQHLGLNPGPYVMLSLSDTGEGMDAETKARIFEPFFTTREQGKGTGLGLATIHGVIKQSGGHIKVESELGQGTTFNIYLPRSKQDYDLTGMQQAQTISEQSLETVLLVEDEDMVRELIYRALSEEGYNVLQASNGPKAVEICEEYVGPIHLLVTDIVMPGGMSGYELVERIVSLRPGIKALCISGYSDQAVAHHKIGHRETPFLQKPFSLDVLAREVRKLLAEP